MSLDQGAPDRRPPGHGRPRLAAIVALAVAILALAGVGTSLAMRNTSVNRQAGRSSPAPTPASSPASSALTGTSPSDHSTEAPTTIQPLGTVPSPPPPTTLPVPPATTSTGTVVITEFTRGPVTVARGSEVEVDLSSSNPHWIQPRAGEPGVLQAMSGWTSADGSAHARFRAVGDGSATVFAAQAPPACSPRCMMPERAWEIGVSVTG